MDMELLAQQLLAFSQGHDRQHDLVLRVGPGHDFYFRFSEDEADPARRMNWEARPRAVGSGATEDGGAGWLARMQFQRDGDGLVGLIVGMPSSLGDARLVAAATSFLLQEAFDVPDNAVVSIAIEVSSSEPLQAR